LKAWAALLAAVFATSCASILIRFSAAPPLVVSFYRMAIASAILLPFAALSSRAWLRDASVVLTALAAGALLGLHFAAWITSLTVTSIASSVVLVATAPIFAALLSAGFLGERAGRAAWIGIALAVIGSLLIAWGDSTSEAHSAYAAPLFGDLLALMGAIFGSAYLTLGRRVRARAPLTGYLTLVYAAGAVVAGLGVLWRGQSFTGYAVREWILFAAIAIFPNLIGHSLLNWGVRRMRTYVVGVAILGEPILATLYAMALFGEFPGARWAAGATLSGAGLVTVFVAEGPRAGAEAEATAEL
jgi:drug/metabolite transporter (DMT)-like permease